LPARRTSKRKKREVLRLCHELNLGQRQMARSCSILVSTVHVDLKRAAAAGVGWPIPAEWNDTQLRTALCLPTATPARLCVQGHPRLRDLRKLSQETKRRHAPTAHGRRERLHPAAFATSASSSPIARTVNRPSASSLTSGESMTSCNCTRTSTPSPWLNCLLAGFEVLFNGGFCGAPRGRAMPSILQAVFVFPV